jgi:transposase
MLETLWHEGKPMALQFVKPYVKTNKGDAADAGASWEAVSSPDICFVAVKNIEQQAVLSLHRARQGFVRARIAQAHQSRGLLGEYELIIPQAVIHVTKRLAGIDDNAVHRSLEDSATDAQRRDRNGSRDGSTVHTW